MLCLCSYLWTILRDLLHLAPVVILLVPQYCPQIAAQAQQELVFKMAKSNERAVSSDAACWDRHGMTSGLSVAECGCTGMPG